MNDLAAKSKHEREELETIRRDIAARLSRLESEMEEIVHAQRAAVAREEPSARVHADLPLEKPPVVAAAPPAMQPVAIPPPPSIPKAPPAPAAPLVPARPAPVFGGWGDQVEYS